MKGKWNNLQKTSLNNNEMGKLVDLKIAEMETSGYITVNDNETCDILFFVAEGKYGDIAATTTIEKHDYCLVQWRRVC